MNQRIIQAYRQAPWRVQLQWIGIFLLVLVGAMLVAGVYLYVSAQATAAGTQIHNLELERENLRISIADLRTQLAHLNSSVLMEVRADALGYHQATQADILYLSIPDYPGRQVVLLAPPPTSQPEPETLVKPAYKESLWEWFYQGAFRLTAANGGQP
jgi:hypothetical protein